METEDVTHSYTAQLTLRAATLLLTLLTSSARRRLADTAESHTAAFTRTSKSSFRLQLGNKSDL